jgi:hypothetical protein
MAYISLIDDLELIQGDSSDLYFIGVKDNRLFFNGWEAEFAIIEDFGLSPIVSRILPINTGVGEGDKYTAGSKFIFQITPTESEQLTAGQKYIVSIRIKNDTIPYSKEIAQFKIKIKPAGI